MTSHVKVMVIFGGSLGEVMSSSVAGSEILSPVALFSLYYTVQQSGCLDGTVGRQTHISTETSSTSARAVLPKVLPLPASSGPIIWYLPKKKISQRQLKSVARELILFRFEPARVDLN